MIGLGVAAIVAVVAAAAARDRARYAREMQEYNAFQSRCDRALAECDRISGLITQTTGVPPKK
jgi:hypothetical protein